MSLKSYTIKMYPDERDFISSILDTLIEKDDDIENRRQAILTIVKAYDQGEQVVTVETLSPDETELKDLCELGFLKKIKEKKTKGLRWFCLRMLRPDKAGRPILMGDGLDPQTIKDLCEACRAGWSWAQSQKLSRDQINAILRFGEREISAQLFACTHPDIDYTQITTSIEHAFYCNITGLRKETIEALCSRQPCDHLFRVEIPIKVKETPAYQQMRQELEDKTK